MRGSWRIGRVAGIGIFVHWSFLILPILVGGSAWMTAGPLAALQATALVLAVFACVVLHELGHALTARKFGIGTRDITLLPIGGVARLANMPEKPYQEFFIAVAGPAVNVVIAAILLPIILLLGGPMPLADVDMYHGPFLVQLFWMNVGLVIFNMIPAFPMDGGRVLRSLLASWLSYERATAIAAFIGQGVAVMFGILGIMGPNIMLIFVGVFIFLAARAEAHMATARARARMAGQLPQQGFGPAASVGDVMLRRFRMLPADAIVQNTIPTVLATDQIDFPVMQGSELVGMLSRDDVLEAVGRGAGRSPLSDVMRRDVPAVQETDQLARAVERMQSGGFSSLPVFGWGRLVGVLSLEVLRKFVQPYGPAYATPAGGVINASGWRTISEA